MKDESRLLESSRNPATRRLLEAGLRDAPPRSALPAVAAALGVAGATLAPSAAAAATSIPVVVLKWFAIGAVVSGSVSAGHWAITRDETRAANREARTAPRAVSPAVEGRRPALERPNVETRAPREIAPVQPLDAPVGTAAAPKGAETASRPAPASKTSDAPARGAVAPAAPSAGVSNSGLATETGYVDLARQALADRDLNRAEQALAAYDDARQLGVLDREALLLRVELAVARGQADRARSLAARFKAAYPTDPHLPRLEQLLGIAKKAE